MDIQITADSTCDLGESVAKRNIGIAPLCVILGDTTYHDGVDITPQDIFAYVEKTGELPKTSTPSIADYEDFFRSYVDEGKTVIHYNISVKASSAHRYAVEAAKAFPGKVFVVDSMGLSTGQGLVVMKACDLRDEGKSAEEIVEETKRIAPMVNTSFVPDRLDYLYKGGRLKKSAATLGKIFRIKPVVTVSHEGKVELCGKAVGTALAIKNVAKRISDVDENFPVEYLYSADDTLCRRLFNETAERIGGAKTEFAANLCPVIGVHIGPGAAGICFVRKK